MDEEAKERTDMLLGLIKAQSDILRDVVECITKNNVLMRQAADCMAAMNERIASLESPRGSRQYTIQ